MSPVSRATVRVACVGDQPEYILVQVGLAFIPVVLEGNHFQAIIGNEFVRLERPGADAGLARSSMVSLSTM